MSNNMIRAMGAIFSHLAQDTHDHKGYFIKETSTADTNWLKYGRMANDPSHEFFPLILVHIEHEDRLHLCICNAEAHSIETTSFPRVEVNSGLFALIIQKVTPPIIPNQENRIANEIFYPRPPDYGGHEFQTIAQFFRNIFVFEVSAENSLDHDFCHVIIANPSLMRTIRNPKLIAHIEDILELKCAFPFKHLALALWSSTYEQTFIELYKVLEALFPILDLIALSGRIQGTVSLKDLHEIFGNFRNWNINERNAFETLEGQMPKQQREAIRATLPGNNGASSIASSIYPLRNRLVHSRLFGQKLYIPPLSWEKYFEAMLMIICWTYQRLSSQLSVNNASDV